MALSSDQLSLLFRARGDTDDAKKAFSELKDSIDGNISAIKTKVASVEGGLKSFASGLQNIGKALTVGLTAPLAALSAISIKAASDLDSLRNNLVSATGSIDAANQKIKEFKKLSSESAGVLVGFAADTYSFLKPMKIGEKTIESFTKALGKIKLQAPDLNAQDFSLNLSQLFSQGFEQQDLKQLVGRFPRIGELLQKQFELKGSDLKSLQDGFQKLKEEGKLSIEDFYKGVADAVNNDASLGLLTDTVSIRFNKATERIGLALAPLGDAILKLIEPLIPKIISFIEYLSNGFTNLSPLMQTVTIAVVAIAAAVGPLLIAVGGLIGFFAPLIAAIATAGGVSALFASAVAVIGPVISALAPILLAAASAIVALGVAAAAVYLLWTTNFAGIRTITLEVFGTVKSFILETVEKIRAGVSAVLTVVSALWKEHGGAITSIVKDAWSTIVTVIGGALRQIQSVINLVINVLRGNWSGAWNNFVEIVRRGAANAVVLLVGFYKASSAILIEFVKLSVKYGTEFSVTLILWINKAIVGVLLILATLPKRIVELIPAMQNAGIQIGTAIYEGIKQGLKEAVLGAPPLTVVQQSAQNTYAKPIDYSDAGAIRKRDEDAAKKPTAGTGNLFNPDDAEKARKDRETAYKEYVADQTRFNDAKQKQEQDNYERIQSQNESNFKSGLIAEKDYQEASLVNLNTFITRSREALDKNFALQSKGLKGTKFDTIATEFNTAQAKLEDLRLSTSEKVEKDIAEVQKKTLDTEKKNLDESVKLTEEAIKRKLAALNREVEAKKRDNETINLRLDKDIAIGATDPSKVLETRKNLEQQLIALREKNLAIELELVKGNADEEIRVKTEQAKLTEEIEQRGYQSTITAIEKEKAARLALLEIQRSVIEAEGRLADFRNEQKRKVIVNTLDTSVGQARVAALQSLRDFDIAEAKRKQEQFKADLEAEHKASLEKIKGKENEEEQKFQIEEVYRNRSLLGEEEFQRQLADIKNKFNDEASKVGNDSFLNRIFGGFADGAIFEKLNENIDGSMSKVFDFQSALQTFGGIGEQILGNLVNALGQGVEQWVLYGGSVGQALKKALAAELAHVAGIAAIKALYATALGFERLAEFNFVGAGNAFISAGLWAALAGGAALAGRALSGSANKQTKNAYAGNNAASQYSNTGSKNGGSVYSPSGDKAEVTTQSRNAPEGEKSAGILGGVLEQKLIVEVRSNDSHIIEVIKEDLRNFGSLRRATIQVLESR